MDEVGGLIIKELWVSADCRPGREKGQWPNRVLLGEND